MGIIRLLLALSVVLYHGGSLFSYTSLDGLEAVKAFFIISGFYMALILNEKYVRKDGSYFLYLSNRFLRIFPVYWAVLLGTIAFSYFWFFTSNAGPFMALNHGHLYAHLLYRSPLGVISDLTLLLRNDYASIDNLTYGHFLIAQAWTLVIELLFYIVAPLLVKRRWWTLGGLLALSFALRFTLYSSQQAHHSSHTSGFFIASLAYFIFGICSYKLYQFLKGRNISQKYTLPFFVIVAIILLWNIFPIHNTHWSTLREWGLNLALPLAIPSIFLQFSKSRLDGFLGELSYPIYISHMLFYNILLYSFGMKEHTPLFVLLLLCLTLLGSYGLVQLVDKPVNRYRQKRL